MNDFTTLVIWVAIALICYVVAKNKGKNEILALAVGLLFGVFSLIYYLLAKGSKEYEVKKAEEKLEKAKKG